MLNLDKNKKINMEEEEERRWHGGQTPRGAQLRRAGDAGAGGDPVGTEPWASVEAGGQYPRRGRGGHASGPVSMHPSRTTKLASSLLPCFIFISALNHHVNDLVCVFPYLITFCPPPL